MCRFLRSFSTEPHLANVEDHVSRASSKIIGTHISHKIVDININNNKIMKIATTTCSLALVLASTIAHLPTANAAVASFTSSSSIRGGAAARLLQSTDGDVTVEEEPEATEEPSVEDEEPSEDSLESLDEEELGRLGLPTERSCTTGEFL